MTKEEYQAELKTLQEGLEGKTSDQIKAELKVFEDKYDAFVETKAKELIGEELLTFKATLEDEYKAAIKEVQDHADKLDVKMKAVKTKANAPEDGIKSLITKEFDDISKVRKGNSIKLETKAVMTLPVNLVGDQPRDYSMIVAAAPSQLLNVSDLVQGINISGGTYTYPRETAITGAPGAAPENVAKPDVDYTITMVDANTDFIAGVTPYSKKMANNLAFLESYIPQALRRDYWKAENASFYTTIAAAATPSTEIITGKNEIEMLINEIAKLEGLDYGVTAVVMTPADYWTIMQIEKSTGAGYGLPGIVTMEGGQLRINGIPLFRANWIATDKYLVGDWTRIKKIITQGLSVEFSTEDQDNFSKNNITARIEAQVTITLERPDSIVLGDFTAI